MLFIRKFHVIVKLSNIQWWARLRVPITTVIGVMFRKFVPVNRVTVLALSSPPRRRLTVTVRLMNLALMVSFSVVLFWLILGVVLMTLTGIRQSVVLFLPLLITHFMTLSRRYGGFSRQSRGRSWRRWRTRFLVTSWRGQRRPVTVLVGSG